MARLRSLTQDVPPIDDPPSPRLPPWSWAFGLGLFLCGAVIFGITLLMGWAFGPVQQTNGQIVSVPENSAVIVQYTVDDNVFQTKSQNDG